MISPIPDDSLGFDPEGFSGISRLFPLPKLLMLPHVVQKFHVFEERYSALTEAALADDGLIALAVLQPGWETDYLGRPPVAPVACLGKILTHHRFGDGRFNLVVAGVGRVRLIREIEPPLAFRRAEAELLRDDESQVDSSRRATYQEALVRSAVNCLPSSKARAEIEKTLRENVPLGPLTDLVALGLSLPMDVQLRLLGETRVDRRAELLLNEFQQTSNHPIGPAGSFPPDFSHN